MQKFRVIGTNFKNVLAYLIIYKQIWMSNMAKKQQHTGLKYYTLIAL